MGFFSAIKKMFGSAEQSDTAAPQDDAAAASVAAETGAESVAETAAPDMAQAAQPLVVSPEDEALTLRLREAEPKLSVWLGIVLEGVDEAGELLFQNNPMSAVCSMVCNHSGQCEGACIQGRKGTPVHFSSIEN